MKNTQQICRVFARAIACTTFLTLFFGLAFAQTLPPPTLIAPGSSSAPGPTLTTTTPTFQWTGVSGAARYGLYISKYPYGSSYLVYTNENISGSTTSLILPSGYLQSGVQYRWNMTTFNSAGQYGNFAPPLYFQTSGTDNATFVSKTVSDNTQMSPGQSFAVTFRMRNSGTTTWTTGASGYTLNFVSGSQMGAPSYVTLSSSVSPGNEVNISVTMTAPTTPGTYTGYWRMNNPSSVFFGDQVSVQIVVSVTDNPPSITAFSINPASIVFGNSFSFSFTITDDVGLSQAELWRTTDLSGSPNSSSWTNIRTTTLSGEKSYPGSFTDAPSSPGIYWYGIHVLDTKGNLTVEPNPPGPLKGTVIAAPPTINTPGDVTSPGPVLTTLTPQFTWNTATGATGYGLYIRDLTTYTLIYPNASGITTTPLTGTSFNLPGGYLVYGHAYRWAMTSFTGSIESGQSSYRYFQTPVTTFGTMVGSFNGVPAYSNGSPDFVSDQYNTDAGINTGMKWQCVEYVNRYYYIIYSMNIRIPGQNANDYFANATTRGLVQYSNGGSNTPQVGDILCFGGGSSGLGHVAIVREVGSTFVKVIQQNVTEDSRDADFSYDLSISGGSYTVSAANLGASYFCQGWLRKSNNPPNIPTAVNQFKSDGTTQITEGNITNESTVIFKGTVSDPDGDQARLEIELRQTNEVFTGTATPETISSFVNSGNQVPPITRGGLVNGNYKWQYRAVDSKGAASEWREFGVAGNTDFVVNTSTPILSVTPDNRDVLSTAGNTTFTVANTSGGTMSYTASVTSTSPWLTITSGTTGGNTGTITASFTANTGTTTRVGTITVTAQGAVGSPKSVTVSQTGVNENPTPQQISDLADQLSSTYKVPSIIINALVEQESGWRQFNDDGSPLINVEPDGRIGIGLMQITVPATPSMQTLKLGIIKPGVQGSNDFVTDTVDVVVDIERLKSDWRYNLETGVRLLVAKKVESVGAPDDARTLENWYYPLAYYNGAVKGGQNDPSNISYSRSPLNNDQWKSKSVFPFQECVYNIIAQLYAIPSTRSGYFGPPIKVTLPGPNAVATGAGRYNYVEPIFCFFDWAIYFNDGTVKIGNWGTRNNGCISEAKTRTGIVVHSVPFGPITTTPTIIVSPPSLSFGNVAINTNSTPQSYTVSGSNLMTNIVISTPTGFQVSTNQTTGFASSLTLAQLGGSVPATTIWARFSPTAAQTYSGNITHTSTGATTQNVAVSGTGTTTGYSISGLVAFSNGSPISGVAMTLSGSQSATTQTDANGNYSFSNLASGGNFTIKPSKANYAFSPDSIRYTSLNRNETANFTGRLVGLMSVSPAAIAFGSVPVGQSKDTTITIRNLPNAAGILSGNVGSLTDQFSVVSGVGNFTLFPAQSCDVIVRFSPTVVGGSTAPLAITHDATNERSPLPVQLGGTGIPAPTIPISPVAPSSVSAGSEFWVDIQVGSSSQPVSNLKVVSFELLYTNTSIIDYVADTLGTFLTGAQKIVIVDDSNGKISASVYRITGGNSGSGVVLRVKFKLLPTASGRDSVRFSFANVQANDIDGATIALLPASTTVTVSTGLLVWPGDADDNGIVNIFDINPIIAIHWSRTGPLRPNASLTWIGQPCPPWAPASATYADCNGEGIVNIFDINAVVVNFGKPHSSSSTVSASETNGPKNALLLASTRQNVNPDPSILVKAPTQVATNQEFWLDIQVGSSSDPVSNLKVVSFELLYTNTAIIDYVTDTLGTFLAGAQKTVIADDPNGKISASVYRITGGNSGSGVVLRLKFKISSAAANGQTIAFTFAGVQANREDGTTQPLTPSGQTVTIQPVTTIESGALLPSKFSLSQNYPNPFNPSTAIHYELPKEAVASLRVFNTLGQLIVTLVDEHEEAGIYQVQWNANVPSGIYFYRLQAGEFVETKKMILLR